MRRGMLQKEADERIEKRPGLLAYTWQGLTFSHVKARTIHPI
jgi:hypothetical protein